MDLLKAFLKTLAKFALRSSVITEVAKQASQEKNSTSVLNGSEINIPEVTELNARISKKTGSRLNILIPGISPNNFFGGASTAIDLFERLLPHFESARIIVTDEVRPNPEIGKRDIFSWSVHSLDHDDEEKYSIIAAGHRYGKTLSVSEGDVFIATAWWTAHLGFQIIDWQNAQFNSLNRQIIYLIQDYEPGFYAWSSRWLLADSTYKFNNRTIAVINTTQLAQHMVSAGYEFDTIYTFEPRLNLGLRSNLFHSPVNRIEKKRNILIYGRPNVERNAYSLLISGVKEWSSREKYIDSKWEVFSVGVTHEDVPLQNGKSVRSLGKLTIDEYANVMRTSSIGVSFMVSPHPSYPPLEMAAFGLLVITNSFGVKKPSTIHSNINALDIVTPHTIADAIESACVTYEKDLDRFGEFAFPYLSESDQFEFAEEIAINIKSNLKINTFEN
jgi:hypothetical protein